MPCFTMFINFSRNDKWIKLKKNLTDLVEWYQCLSTKEDCWTVVEKSTLPRVIHCVRLFYSFSNIAIYICKIYTLSVLGKENNLTIIFVPIHSRFKRTLKSKKVE